MLTFAFGDIKEKFKSVISYSQGIDNPKIDKLFDIWLDAKRDFIEAMDGKLIYEYPTKVSLTLEQHEKDNRINYFLDMIEDRWENEDLSFFVNTMRDGFFNNLTTKDYIYKDKKIKKGTKLVKAFKYFEKDKNVLTDIQNCASRIIQEDKIEGTLCLSVHPLDYLSISENNHNWRSCHALDGDYRSGNLSYMVDSSTIICYLKSEKDEILPNFPFEWNSKKWRVLLYFSKDWHMIMAGRQYPFPTITGLDFITKELLPSSGLSKIGWTKWHDEILDKIAFSDGEGEFSLNKSYIPVGGSLIPLKELVIDNEGSKQFNDLLESSCYSPLYAYRHSDFWWDACSTGASHSEFTRFFIGGKAPCLVCEKHPIDYSEHMVCENCYSSIDDNDDKGYCFCCNRRINFNEAYYVEDEILCDQCYEQETSECEVCGERIFNNEISLDRESGKYICSYCKENYNR